MMAFRITLVLAWLLSEVAVFGYGTPHVLNIRSYVSPSSKWSLEIDPSELHGSGKGRYTMSSSGKVVWSRELPFTLLDAEVTDEGVTVGYACSHGVDGYIKGNRKDEPGTLAAVILNANGTPLLHDAVKREQSGVLHSLPVPLARGFLLHPGSDRFTLRVKSASGEVWWHYRLSTGQRLTDTAPQATAKSGRISVISARVVRDLPLTIVHGWFYETGGSSGTSFMLADVDGKVVQALDLPADFATSDDPKLADSLRSLVWRQGAILTESEKGTFALWHVKASQRARYKVLQDSTAPSGWRVNEVSREAYQPPEKSSPAPEPEKPTLPPLGSFGLSDQVKPGPVRNIAEFGLDKDGRIGFLRQYRGEDPAFVLLESSGNVAAEIALPKVGDWRTRLAWIAGEYWLYTTSELGTGGKSRGWWIDAPKRSITEIEGFDCPAIESLSGTGDGGFVVLAVESKQNSQSDYLIAFDAQGKQRWKIAEDSGNTPGAMLSPEGVTVTGHQEIAVVDVIRHNVLLFSLEGKWLRTVDLNKAWKRNPSYPSDITPDMDGGFIVYDFDAEMPFVRMKADGTVRAELRPKHADGRAVDSRSGLRAAPDGSLWTSDRHSMMQLSDDGVVSRVLGPALDANRLSGIASLTVDPKGSLYAVDERSGAVHVFNAEGQKLHVCKPDAGDFSANVRSPHLTVTSDGTVLLARDHWSGKGDYLQFASDGHRVGRRSLDVDSISQNWYAQPGPDRLLVLGYEAVFMMDQEGKILRTLERRQDRKWLESPAGAAVAGNGDFAVLAMPKATLGSGQTINFYLSGGDAAGMIEVPDGFMQLRGFNGTHVTLSAERNVLVYDRSGVLVHCVPGPSNAKAGWEHCLTRDGRELWVVDYTSRQVKRYAMP